MVESRALRFGIDATLVKHASLKKAREVSINGWTARIKSGAILGLSYDGESYFSVPKDTQMLLRLSKMEFPSGRKRVPTTVEEIEYKGGKVPEITAYGSVETIVSVGNTVYALEKWFRPPPKPKSNKPRVTQRRMRI